MSNLLKRILLIAAIILVSGIAFLQVKLSFAQTVNSVSSALSDSSIYQADPTIFLYNGIWYLYGTNGMGADSGIKVFTSTDLRSWKVSATANKNGYALVKPASFGTSGFWAPQVWKYKDQFYMASVANEQIAIAKSKSVTGPFLGEKPIAFEQRNIDPFIFIEKGKKYLFHVDISHGNKIYVAEINEDFSAIKPETRKFCLAAVEPWETVRDHVVEGPTVLKHKNLYYLIYSANHFISPDYAVGYATSTSVFGPWKKYAGNPILSRRSTMQPGTGHGDIFFDRHNNMYYVFHTHHSTSAVAPRRTAVAKAWFEKDGVGKPEKLVIDSAFFFLKRKD